MRASSATHSSQSVFNILWGDSGLSLAWSASATGSCQSVFRLGNVLWCVVCVWGGGGGGGYVCLCDVKPECGLCQVLVAVTLCSGLSLSAGFISYL